MFLHAAVLAVGLISAATYTSAKATSTEPSWPYVLAPCPSEFMDDYLTQVDETINVAARGIIRVSFTALPSFKPEWGLRGTIVG